MKARINRVGILSAAVAAMLGLNVQAMTLADASKDIGKAIENPPSATETMKQLTSVDDQKSYVGKVNAAIAKMPGSNEEKAAKFLNVDRALIKGAKKDDMKVILAEIFATARVEALPIISETFAEDLFNRSAKGNEVSDDQFSQTAKDVMKVVNERNAAIDNGPVRSTFALLMFLRASNGSPKDLADVLIETLPEQARGPAKDDWVKNAMAEGDAKSYEPMMVAADAGQLPNPYFTIRVAGVQDMDALLHDLIGASTDPNMQAAHVSPVQDAVLNPLMQDIPFITIPGVDDMGIVIPPPPPPPPPPGPYPLQSVPSMEKL